MATARWCSASRWRSNDGRELHWYVYQAMCACRAGSLGAASIARVIAVRAVSQSPASAARRASPAAGCTGVGCCLFCALTLCWSIPVALPRHRQRGHLPEGGSPRGCRSGEPAPERAGEQRARRAAHGGRISGEADQLGARLTDGKRHHQAQRGAKRVVGEPETERVIAALLIGRAVPGDGVCLSVDAQRAAAALEDGAGRPGADEPQPLTVEHLEHLADAGWADAHAQ